MQQTGIKMLRVHEQNSEPHTRSENSSLKAADGGAYCLPGVALLPRDFSNRGSEGKREGDDDNKTI